MEQRGARGESAPTPAGILAGAVHATSDIGWIRSPDFIWGKCGETLWARDFLLNKLKDKSVVYREVFSHLVPCPECHPALLVPREGLPKPPAFVRDMRSNPMPSMC